MSLNRQYLQLIGDDIYCNHEKVATLCVPTSTLRDFFVDTLMGSTSILMNAQHQGFTEGYEVGCAAGAEELRTDLCYHCEEVKSLIKAYRLAPAASTAIRLASGVEALTRKLEG